MKTCGHCGAEFRYGGGISRGSEPWVDLCHPDVGMDCYRLVTIYDEPIGARLPGGPLDGKPTRVMNKLPF